MASLIYNSAVDDEARGNIDYDSDSFKCMLLSSAYTPDKDAHTKRSDLTAFEIAGADAVGYTAGGVAATVTVTKDNATDRVDITLGGISIPSASIKARYGAYYKARGGLASADNLVAVVDFGADVQSTNSTWALTASTLRKQN